MNENHPATVALGLARDRTLGAGTARIELVIDYVWTVPPSPRRRRGGLLRPVLTLGKVLGKQLFKVATRGHDFRRLRGQGMLDSAWRSYMLDYGDSGDSDSYRRLYSDGQEWHGTSNRPLTRVSADHLEPPSPLWLFDILSGVTAAGYVGDEEIRGRACRRIAATTDLARVCGYPGRCGRARAPALRRAARVARRSVDRRCPHSENPFQRGGPDADPRVVGLRRAAGGLGLG